MEIRIERKNTSEDCRKLILSLLQVMMTTMQLRYRMIMWLKITKMMTAMQLRYRMIMWLNITKKF